MYSQALVKKLTREKIVKNFQNDHAFTGAGICCMNCGFELDYKLDGDQSNTSTIVHSRRI